MVFGYKTGNLVVIAAKSNVGKTIYGLTDSQLLEIIAEAYFNGKSREYLKHYINALKSDTSRELVDELFSNKYCHLKQWIDRTRPD